MNKKYLSIAINVLMLGGIIYLILKVNNLIKTNINNNASSESSSSMSELSAESLKDLTPLNWSRTLDDGVSGTEVLALQRMIQEFIPSQPLTGIMDSVTMTHLDDIREGIRKGATNLDDFSTLFFIPAFGTELHTAIINEFPKN